MSSGFEELPLQTDTATDHLQLALNLFRLTVLAVSVRSQ